MQLFHERDTQYAAHTKHILQRLVHVTQAIIEYQPLPAGGTIRWTAIELIFKDGVEMLGIVGVVLLTNDDGHNLQSKLHGLIPMSTVLKFNKQLIFEYFDTQARSALFANTGITDTDTIH